MKHLLPIALVALAPLIAPVAATAGDMVTKTSTSSVADTMDALEAAVSGAGATVFARVDHAGGAKSVDMDLADAQLLIFGNPRLGTPAMQDDPRAGLFLPLRVLVYADSDGTTHVTYQVPSDMLSDLNVPADAEYLKKMTGALDKLTGAAVGG